MPTAKRSATKQNDSQPTPAPAPKAPRKPSRPRIDAILNAIVRGDYDDKLKELREAITQRNELRKSQVLALVREVYGDEAEIATPEDSPLTKLARIARGTRSNPFIEKAVAEGTHYPADELASEEPESFDEPEVPSITSASKSVQVVQGPDDTDLDDNGGGGVTIVSTGGGSDEIISNSPLLS